jgi:predicted alpha-1,2-mannosidase
MTQGGSNSDVVLADAAIKGLPGFDYVKAYEAMVKNAEVDSPRPLHEGRELGDYLRLGYMSMPTINLKDVPATRASISTDEYEQLGYQVLRNSRSASRTMEYAYNDFCVAQMAWVLGRKADHQKYLLRSRNWTNLWDPETRSIRPRFADGRWLTPFSPTHNYPDKEYDFWDSPFYEGNGWQYTTYVPHDVQALINRFGGREKFVKWLDELFEMEVYNRGNEPDFLVPYLYIHAGRPDRTADRVREILSTRYTTGRAGLPGNDDAGAMSAWYIWGAIGIYPNAGQDYYYIGSPLFPKVTLSLGQDKPFTIDAQETSSSNRYVQSVTLNGRSLTRPWLRHSEIARGGHLVLTMGSKPSPWGRENPPFSLSLVDKNWGTSQ